MTRLGILVGGGPAPGINCAISSATIEACNEGLQVVGIYDGFEHLMGGDSSPVTALDIRSVSRIHAEGGSILRTARANPTTDPALVERTVQTLQELGVSLLVSIGGEDTASSAAAVARRSGGTIRVAHIPKTIDNDLPLPAGLPTFGYETARHVGTEQVLNLTEEARSTARWVIVVIMGRNAGHLALGIGKAAGATLTIIPEEFGDRMVTLDHISAIIEGSIFKRRRQDRPYGVAVVAEGVVSRMQPDEV
ncbi:MAG: 6-phosphofructokinase, partial [Chloroflexota bacterium]